MTNCDKCKQPMTSGEKFYGKAYHYYCRLEVLRLQWANTADKETKRRIEKMGERINNEIEGIGND